MGEFDATLGMGLMADDLAEEMLKRADGSYEEASAALTEFAHGVQERLSELSKARHLVAELAVTDERFAEFGKRVAADMGSLKCRDDATVAESASRHARSVFRDSSPTLSANDKRWEAFKRLNEL